MGPESLRKSKALLDREFGPWCKGRKLYLLKLLGPAELREFRNGWNNSAATTLRKHERNAQLFCIQRQQQLAREESDGGSEKARRSSRQADGLLYARRLQQNSGGDKDRLRALVLLIRWSVFRSRTQWLWKGTGLTQRGSLLLRRAKTGAHVYVPSSPGCV